jgi:myosin-5
MERLLLTFLRFFIFQLNTHNVVLESNPILEAFGNARTVRNDNSSRFGKFIELQFKQSGSLIGANIDTYLLEKVRLVHQAEGERNFHIFYQMIAAATEEERKTFLLDEYTIKDFNLTNKSGTYDRRDGADDGELFDELVFAMGTMGFDPQIQEELFSCIAAFMHASNLTFTAPTEESSKVDESNPHLQAVLKLLGIEQDAFNAAMTEFEIDVGNQSYTRQLTVEGAEKTLEAFIKGVYGALFSFIVSTINKRIDYKPQKALSPVLSKLLGKAASISVLDIFGFESFRSNSFEQLCINYCNEALQQQFNLFIFKSEQEEYKKEGEYIRFSQTSSFGGFLSS